MAGARPQNIAILGSTGSIGTNTLEVVGALQDHFRVTYLTVNKNIEALRGQIERFHPRGVVVLDKARAAECRAFVNGSTEVLCGPEGLVEVARRDDVDILVSSLVGFAGLLPTIEAIKAGKKVALANKETLVVAGEIIIRLAKEHHVDLVPVDSEHSAIFQCLIGESRDRIRRIILTASGGPFRNHSIGELAHVTVEEALRHPNWKMGDKITIDSATLMNKGLEVIEAHWLFGVAPENIDVIIHPQSIIHSMVEFVDGSVKAQLGMPDMKIPIQYALTYPRRTESGSVRVDFPRLRGLTFEEPDRQRFRCLQLAFNALSEGGTMPAAMNAANEVAVAAFLAGRTRFLGIPEIIAKTMDQHHTVASPGLEDIVEADRWARGIAEAAVR